MAKDLAIILNNGGINSAVATALAAQKYRPILLFAETAPAEGTRARAAYEQQVAHFKPYREHTLSMPFAKVDGQHAAGAGAGVPAAAADPRHQAPLGPQMIELLPLVASAVRFAAHYQAAAVYLGMRVGPRGDELSQAT